MTNAVVLLSGGMDSSTLLHFVKRRLKGRAPACLSFDYGQRHSRELAMAKWQARAAGAKEHIVVDISFMKGLLAGSSALTDRTMRMPDLSRLSAAERKQPPTYVPNRNMILLNIAAAYAEAIGASVVYYGAHAQDRYGYWDCTGEFIARLNRVLALNRRKPVTIRAPFMRKNKAGIVRLGASLNVDFSRTWSCYAGGRRPCGTCPTCVDRRLAFEEAGIVDPLPA
jgi:7-cyano-7-deazaguanine synthase